MINEIELIEVDSTNDYAKEIAEKGADNFTVVWTHRQTKGRGSRNREWESSEGNVFYSVILRPSSNWSSYTEIVYVNALAIYNSIAKFIGNENELQIKWPNDILLNGKKVAGTLLESSNLFNSKNPKWIVIGTGINVIHSPQNSNTMTFPPTSLVENGCKVSRELLIQELNSQLQVELQYWLTNGFQKVKERYLKHAFRLNQVISIGMTQEKSNYTTGKYLGIDDYGSLEMMLDDGTIKKFFSGDVFAF